MRRIRAGRCYDCGETYNPIVQDIDHDGPDEVLVYDRDHVCIFDTLQ